MKKALLLFNQGSRRASDVAAEARACLQHNGVGIAASFEAGSDRFDAIIREHRKEIDGVILAGGDGTLSCALDALRETGLPLGILPCGTANNIAHDLAIPLAITDACEVIARGRTRRIDLVRVNGTSFISIAGIGLSTDIHRHVPAGLKKRLGPIAYAIQGVSLLKSARGFRAEIVVDGKRFRTKALQITLCNGQYFGGNLAFRDDATLSDGRIDVAVVQSQRWFSGLYWMLLGKNDERFTPGLLKLRGRRIEITTRPALRIDADGAEAGTTPASFEIIPSAITVLVPQAESAVAA